MSSVTKYIKLVVVGDNVPEGKGTAKTALLMSYANNRYPEDMPAGGFDNYVVNLLRGQNTIELGLWSIEGSLAGDDYDRLRPLSYANTNIFIVLFSVVNPESYEKVSSKWIPELIHFCPDIPTILVGCQIELRDDGQTLKNLKIQRKKPIAQEQGHLLAEKAKAVRYIECSARTGDGLKHVFDEAVKIALKTPRERDKYRLFYTELVDNAVKTYLAETNTTRRSLIHRKRIVPPPPRSYFLNEKQQNRKSTWHLDAFSAIDPLLEERTFPEDNEDLEPARQVPLRVPLALQQSDFKEKIDAFLVPQNKRNNLKEWSDLLSYICNDSAGLSLLSWKRLEKQYYIAFLSNDSLDISWVADLQNTLNILLKSAELNPLLEQWTKCLLANLKSKMQRSIRENKWSDPGYPVKKIWEDIAEFLKYELSLELDRFSNKDAINAVLIEWLVSIAQCLGEKDMSAILMCKAIALSHQEAPKKRQNLVSLYTLADRVLWKMMADWQHSRSELTGFTSKTEAEALMLEEMIEGIKSTLQEVRTVLKAKPHESVLSQQAEMMPLKEANLDKLLNGLQNLWQASLDRMGFAPPCTYTLVLLGSWARLDHTPYSDLEFLLLIGPQKGAEKVFAERLEDKEIESYFRQCFDLFLVQIDLLGEGQDKRHILGNIPHRVGIHVDDILLPFKGCECFFGTIKDLVEKFSLDEKSLGIFWPEYIEAVKDKQVLQGTKDRYSVIAAAASYDARFFCGDEILFRDYLQARQKILSAGTGLEGYSSQAVLALSFFREAILPRYKEQRQLSQEMQVKSRFLSMVSGIIKILSLYHGLQENGLSLMSTRERCRQLVFNGIIHKNLGVCLEIAYDFSNRLRALTHCDYDNEFDYWLLFGENPRVISKRLWQHYPQIWKETIVMLHEVIYPLHNAFADWVDAAQIEFFPIRSFSLAPEILDRCQDTLANEGMNIAHRFAAVAGEILLGDNTGQGTFLFKLDQRWWQFLLAALLHLSPRERASLWLKVLPKLSLEEREQFLEAWDALMQNPLSLEQQHGYFSKIEIKTLREEIAAEFVAIVPHVIFEDGWTILSYRKQQQWQQAVNGLFSAPFSLETNDLADAVVQKKSVIVGCLDPRLNAPEIRKRVQQDEATSGLFALNPEIQTALERDEERAFTEARKDPSGKRHIVLFFENKMGDETHHFCLKIFPENPGMEYFITQLQYTLGGDELPDVWLWRIYSVSYPNGIAALLMEDVRGLRYKPEDKALMLNLSQVRKENPGIFFVIDEDSFTRHFLRVILTTPEDDKPNDYYVIPGNRKNVALRGRYILHRVDNERSLYVSELFEHKKPLLGQSTYNSEEVDKVLKLKTVIFCMENMGAPLSAAVLRNFMQLDMKKTFKHWLEQIEAWNAAARETFKFKGIMSNRVPSSALSSSTLFLSKEPFEVARMHYQGNFYRHGVFHFAPNPLHVKEIENFCLTVLPVPMNKFVELYLLLEQMKLFLEKNVKEGSIPTGLETLRAIRTDQYKHYHDNINPSRRIGIKETDIRRLSEGVFKRFDQATEGGYNRSGESSQVYRSMVTSGLGTLMRAEDFEAVLQGGRSGKEAATADTVEGLLFTLEKYELSKNWSDDAQMVQQMLLDRFWDILAAPIAAPSSRFGFFIADDSVGKRLNQILTEFSNLSYSNKLEVRRYFLGGRKKKGERPVSTIHPEIKKCVLQLLLNEPLQAEDPPLRRLDTSEFQDALNENDLLRLLQKHGKTLEKAIIVTSFNPYKIRGFKKYLEACLNLKHLELRITLTEEKMISRELQSIECHLPQLQTLALSRFLNVEILRVTSPKLMHLSLRSLQNLNSLDIRVQKLQFIEICHCPRVYSHVFQGAIIGRLSLDQKMPVIQLENVPIKKNFLMKLMDEMLWQEPDMASKITLAAQFTLEHWKRLEQVLEQGVLGQEHGATVYKIQLDASLEKYPGLKKLFYSYAFAKALMRTIKFLDKFYPELEFVSIVLNDKSIAAKFKADLKLACDYSIEIGIWYNDTSLYIPFRRKAEPESAIKLPEMRK